MQLYFVQHGEALAKDVDPDRPLSDKGRTDIKRLATWLAAHNVKVAQILHSGKTRARQTAQLLESLLVPGGQIRRGEGLAPNDSPDAFLGSLGDSKKDSLIAGHMPFVARVVSLAIADAPDRQLVEFQPGSVAGIVRDEEGPWRLFLFAQPQFS